jgi:hypothetical protein
VNTKGHLEAMVKDWEETKHLMNCSWSCLQVLLMQTFCKQFVLTGTCRQVLGA